MMPDLKIDLQRGADAFGSATRGLDDLRLRRARRERRRRASAGLTALVVTALAGAVLWQAFRPAGAGTTVGTDGVQNGPITFTIGELGGKMEGIDIGSVEADGSGRSTLAEGVRDFITGGWSPDGTQIVFAKEGAEPGTADIWIMDADGTSAQALTSGPEWDGWAQWSPAGDRIAFVRTEAPGAVTSPSGLYVMDPDGSNLRLVVGGDDWPSVLFFSWSPQGDRLAFTSYGSAQEGIFTIDADGTNPRLVFEGSGGTVLWSPDGSQLLFDSKLGVSVMNADGTGIRSLVTGQQMQTYEIFRWSPDGTQILYVRPVEEDLSDQLRVIDANGTNDRVLADDLTWRDGGAAWSPDGTQIAFNRAGDVWSVALDGSGERQITNTIELESAPSWGIAQSAPGSNATASDLADDLVVSSSFRWEKPDDSPGKPVLIVGSGQDERLTTCGSDAWEGSMLVLAPEGVAYCIQSVDMSDPESIAAARILAMQLQGDTFTDAELNVLRLQTLSGYAPPESPEAAAYRDELLAAWEALSPAEQEHLLE